VRRRPGPKRMGSRFQAAPAPENTDGNRAERGGACPRARGGPPAVKPPSGNCVSCGQKQTKNAVEMEAALASRSSRWVARSHGRSKPALKSLDADALSGADGGLPSAPSQTGIGGSTPRSWPLRDGWGLRSIDNREATADQRISGSAVDGAPTEEPEPDASNARSQRPATRAIVVSRAFACVLNTRGCPQAFYINFPGKQVNAVWGRSPYRMYDVCKKGARSVLGARRQNLSRPPSS
jgi:hypothetical protein